MCTAQTRNPALLETVIVLRHLETVIIVLRIAVLRVLGERSIQHGRTVNICFVDYEKAFDRIYWKRIY